MSKKCTPLWREAHFQVKMYKTHQLRTTFGSWDVEKVHAVVARSTFRSQNVQNTRGSDHFQMSKKCTRLWCEAHFEVKMLKTPGVRTTFGGSDVASLHYTTLHYTTLHYTTLHYTTLHSTTLQLLISPQNQDRLRLIQHWWWKFQTLICNPYNYILNYMAYRCDVR